MRTLNNHHRAFQGKNNFILVNLVCLLHKNLKKVCMKLETINKFKKKLKIKSNQIRKACLTLVNKCTAGARN